MVRLLGDDSRRQIPDLTTDLAPQRDVYGSWAESSHGSRHDDVDADVADARNRCYYTWT